MVRKKLKRQLRVSRYILYRETLVDPREHAWSFLGSFIGIGLIAFLQSHVLDSNDQLFLIGSFGASSVLVYGAIQSPLAQPRNLLGGHVVSATIGVAVCQLLPDILWLTAPLAVSFAIVGMQWTKTLHPPGGATALIAVSGSAKIKALGFLYVLYPVFSGAMILLLVALVFNNMTPHRRYPAGKRRLSAVKRLFRVRRRVLK